MKRGCAAGCGAGSGTRSAVRCAMAWPCQFKMPKTPSESGPTKTDDAALFPRSLKKEQERREEGRLGCWMVEHKGQSIDRLHWGLAFKCSLGLPGDFIHSQR